MLTIANMTSTSCFILFIIFLFPSVFGIPKLMVVSFDGFRFDYFDRNLTPYLNSLKRNSTYSQYIMNVFPTQTFTNHFSLATGMYSETHGVLATHTYDPKRRELLGYGFPMFHYCDKITPIWSLNENRSMEHRSGVMMWPGGEFEYNGINATFRTPFDYKIQWKDRVETVMNWLKHPKTPVNLIFLYFEDPDFKGHIYGPNSEQTNEQIRRVDHIANYIQDSLDKNELSDVNLIFTSDHGMESVPKSNIIDLLPIVGNISNMYGTSPVLQVYPKPGVSEETVFQKLKASADSNKNFRVFKKKDVPDYLHYKNCGRAPPLVVVANPPYAFQDLLQNIEEYKRLYNISGSGPFGIHGYDPKTINMHPFLLAKGPLFKQNYTPKHQIESVDFYHIFTHALQLELPEVRPNGSFSNVADIFRDFRARRRISFTYTVLGFSALGSFFIILLISLLYFKYIWKKPAPKRSYVLCLNSQHVDNAIDIQEPLLSPSQDSLFPDS